MNRDAHPSTAPAGRTAGRLASVARARERLAALGVGNPALEADLLMSKALAASRVALYREADRDLTPEEDARFAALLERRLLGVPLQYVLGRAEFFGLDLRVPEGVFIPRPETEILVEAALSFLEDGAVFADIGTGSGAVALAVLAHRPRARALATDISEGAADAARGNAAALGFADRLQVAAGDLLDPFEPVVLDAVLSNPPYIREGEIAGLPAEIRDHEPRASLAGGADGLDVVRRILERAPGWLRPGGLVAIEIGYDQGAAAVEAARAIPGLGSAAVLPDLAGRDRTLRAIRR